MTMALLPGSPALDAGVVVAGDAVDQRGVPRPQGAAPDIGAFEARGFIARRGALHPGAIVLRLDRPMDAAQAEDPSNYRLVWSGRDRVFGTADDRVIGIRRARYAPGRHAVRLWTAGRLDLPGAYWLTVVRTPAGGLNDAAGAYPAAAGRLRGRLVVYLGPE